MSLNFLVGTNSDGPVYADLAELPHLLVAGTTGSGKSVFIHSLIVDLLETSNAQFLMIDPKRVELSMYRGSPRLVRPPITNVNEVAGVLRWAEFYMESRYRVMEANGVRDCADLTPIMPRLVIVIDELANVILSDKTVEKPLVAIASQGRAAGIHLVAATQRPSADVLTGLLRANVPARVAFATVTSIESRIILDETGAENLKGKGDMLYRNGTQVMHICGRLVDDKTIKRAAQGTQR